MANAKTFNYINDLGCPKQMVVSPKDTNDQYPVTIWNLRNGEHCGSSRVTFKELHDFLAYYGYFIREEEMPKS